MNLSSITHSHKRHHLSIIIVVSTLMVGFNSAFAQTDHTNMDHNTHMKTLQQQGDQTNTATPNTPVEAAMTNLSNTPLKEAGNALFGTIQEAITMLDANPDTDWSKVDLEALRQHLIDMENFSSHVKVLSQVDIEHGTLVVIQPSTEAARASLTRALAAHPGMLKQETGWIMSAETKGATFELTIISHKPAEVARLRGLGYIGVMALGNHHQVHHWLMASGANPHEQHSH